MLIRLGTNITRKFKPTSSYTNNYARIWLYAAQYTGEYKRSSSLQLSAQSPGTASVGGGHVLNV